MIREALVFLIIANSLVTSAYSDITYHVLPVALSNGYEITGGTITTNGTIGLPSESDFKGFSITVAGPVATTFEAEGTGGAGVGGIEAIATI